MDRIRAHELALTNHALARLDEKLGLDCRIFGPPAGADRGGVMSIAYRDVHAHDLAQVLDQKGVLGELPDGEERAADGQGVDHGIDT